MNFENLNKVALLQSKPIGKLIELPLDVPHEIYGAKILNTKFGETILLELKEKKIFLPNRVVNQMKDNLPQFIDGKYSIIYQGLREVNKPSMGVMFRFVESK